MEWLLLINVREAWRKLSSSRGYSYDDPELDIFEAFKYISFCMGTFTWTAQFLMCT